MWDCPALAPDPDEYTPIQERGITPHAAPPRTVEKFPPSDGARCRLTLPRKVPYELRACRADALPSGDRDGRREVPEEKKSTFIDRLVHQAYFSLQLLGRQD